MDHRNDEDWEALARYIAGESTPAEAADVRRWLAEDPAGAAGLDVLLPAIERLGAAEPALPAAETVEQALARVHAQLDAGVEPIDLSARRTDTIERSARRTDTIERFAHGADTIERSAHGAERARTGASTIPWRVAAALAIGGAALWFALDPSDPAPVASADAAAATYATETGVTREVRLADGTRVVLGPRSTLRAAAGYGGTERIVELDGIAYFDVVHDDARPFRVRAGAATIRDIGTRFTVRTRNRTVDVVVMEGAVLLGAARDSLLLRAGEAAVVDAERGLSRLPVADVESETAWTQGRLVFDDDELDRVADEVMRWYGVRLIAGDGMIAQRQLTATFEGEDVQDVLRVLGLALDARLEQRGDSVFLYAR